MRLLKWLLPLLLALLAGCAVAPAGPEPGAGPGSEARGQPEPPASRLEHPGRPASSGQFWIAGHWEWIDGRYQWQAGRWVAPRPGHVWQAPVWRRGTERWQLEPGRWEPERHESAQLRRH
ncbi:MAG: hypothetical protein RLZZ22_1158 [Pseudomonadota bacterium]|jgi:hypothetical protein